MSYSEKFVGRVPNEARGLILLLNIC